MSDSESNVDSLDTETNNYEFFHDMIRDAIRQNENEDEISDEEHVKIVYKSVVEKCKSLYQDMKDASEDDLWTAINDKEEKFTDENTDLKINYDTAFNVGLKKYKCVIMQEIESILNEDKDDDEEEEEESETIEDLDERNKVNLVGSGLYKNFINKRY